MNAHPKLRIGAVSYLNTKPLIYGIERFAPQAELVLDYPSRLADDLARGRLDVALIPSIEFFHDPSYSIVSDACIACRGPVLSVKLFSRGPIEAIRTLALDEGSRTSVALVRILLAERYGVRPRIEAVAGRRLAGRQRCRRGAADRRSGHALAGRAIRRSFGTWATSGAAGPSCRSCSRCGSRGPAPN